MNTGDIAKIEPLIAVRQCGGWLAFSPVDSPVKIGVTAPDREGAVAGYSNALLDWLRNLENR